MLATSPESSSFPIVTMAAVATRDEYKEAVPSLAELQERRAYECRLTPDRALETLDDAAAFVRDRGLLTRTTDCALPSLHEACHEEPYKPGRRRLRRVAARRSGRGASSSHAATASTR